MFVTRQTNVSLIKLITPFYRFRSKLFLLLTEYIYINTYIHKYVCTHTHTRAGAYIHTYTFSRVGLRLAIAFEYLLFNQLVLSNSNSNDNSNNHFFSISMFQVSSNLFPFGSSTFTSRKISFFSRQFDETYLYNPPTRL